MFVQPFSSIKTKAADATAKATIAATDTTIGGKSRSAVEVYAVSDLFVGGSDVTADNGIPLKTGESKVFPVFNYDSVYIIGGKAIIADYY